MSMWSTRCCSRTRRKRSRRAVRTQIAFYFRQGKKRLFMVQSQKTKQLVPRMASLPRPRMALRSHPFPFVGLDYFGALKVTIGRRREKQWVALFTCMSRSSPQLDDSMIGNGKSKVEIWRPIVFSVNGRKFIGASSILPQHSTWEKRIFSTELPLRVCQIH